MTSPLVIELGDWEAGVKAEAMETGDYKMEGSLLPLMMGEELDAWRVSFPWYFPSWCPSPLGGSTSLHDSSPGAGN